MIHTRNWSFFGYSEVLNKIKTLLFGDSARKERRRISKPGLLPLVGSHISKGKAVLRVDFPMDQGLWDFLTLMGWREVNMKRNRRKLHILPSSMYDAIANAPAEMREEVHRRILSQVKKISEK